MVAVNTSTLIGNSNRRRDKNGRLLPHYNFTKAFLIKHYIQFNRGTNVIALSVGCSRPTVLAALKKHGIKIRDTGSALRGKGRNLIGKKFGKLKVTAKNSRRRSDSWLAVCECGHEYPYRGSSLICVDSPKCRVCRANSTKHGEIQRVAWREIVHGAARRKLEFSITIEDAYQIFLKQDRKCTLSGVPIVFAGTRRGHAERRESTASLDRIDSNFGYVPGNVQWVHKIVNLMKQKLSQPEFISWCKLIALENR